MTLETGYLFRIIERTNKKILGENPGIRSTAILDQLFPDMDPALKDNAKYEIQVVLGRDYHGR